MAVPLTDREHACWREGWSYGRDYCREYLYLFGPWAKLRKELRGLVNERALMAHERSAYRQVLRLMSAHAKRERTNVRKRRASPAPEKEKS